jgi:hypothetical protein
VDQGGSGETLNNEVIDVMDMVVHHERGCALQMQGNLDAAVASYRRALDLDAACRAARRSLGILLVRMGRGGESVGLWQEELSWGADRKAWMSDAIVRAMQARDLSEAGELAAIFAQLRLGTEWYPGPPGAAAMASMVKPPEVYLSISKLHHDAEQFRHLRAVGVLGKEFDAIIREYWAIADRLRALGMNARVALQPEDEHRIGHVYGRLVHVRDTPRVAQALSGDWDRATVQHYFLDKPPGVVVIDGFLAEPVLESLRRFCIESTVWSGNRYADGRLGAFFFDGFNCPLLLQIAEEVRDSLPDVIGSHHALRQLWEFKNSPYLPADSTIHADFAAVNVNFWITPEEANLDEASGGLVIYDVDAPLSWDFATYNERLDLIREFLGQRRARSITIPYRQNRAIIFNSDLFHATAQIRFRPEFENRRVNITMLYGDREHDRHHPSLSGRTSGRDSEPASSAWRSAAFARARRQ